MDPVIKTDSIANWENLDNTRKTGQEILVCVRRANRKCVNRLKEGRHTTGGSRTSTDELAPTGSPLFIIVKLKTHTWTFKRRRIA